MYSADTEGDDHMTEKGEVIIRTEGLTKCYGEKAAVSDLDLEIRAGEIFGLLGPNGAGKTTTTLMLLGLCEPTSGSAFIDGIDCTRDPIRIKRMTGYLPDNVGFYPDMTGRENLKFIGRLNGLSEEIIGKRSEELLEKVGMAYAADKKTGTYSRGMKQRLGIADVLMKDPKIVIMDEPTLGLDPEGMRELMDLIRRLSEEEGRTILISSHQLYQVQQICDRVGLFVEGKLIASGRIDELYEAIGPESINVLETAAYPDNRGFENLLKGIPGVTEVERENDFYVVRSERDIRRELQAEAVSREYVLTRIRQRGSDLDEIYRRYFETDEKAGMEHGDVDRKTKRFSFARKN